MSCCQTHSNRFSVTVFSVTVSELFTQPTLAAQFWHNVAILGDIPALIASDATPSPRGLQGSPPELTRELTWGQVAAVVECYMQWLQQQGVTAGQCVATQLPNSLDWIAIDLACQTLGCIHCAIDPREPPLRVRDTVAACGARLLLRPPVPLELELSLRMRVNPLERLEAARRIPARSAALLLSTSGTSGIPKLVTLSHRNLLSNAYAKLEAAPQFASDLRLNILPFAHAYARTCELSTWILSRSRLALAANWDKLVQLAVQLQPTLINLVPYLAETLASTLSADRRALGMQLRLLQVGGAALPDALWQQLHELGLPPLQGYGLTEASPVVCSNRAGSQRPGTIGSAVAGVENRLDEHGVLWTRGPHVMLGYWDNPTATAEVLREGWLCTGDICEPASGGLRITGRLSQQIVLSTGYKVSPELVESRLLAILGVEQAVVLGHQASHITAWVWPAAEQISAEWFSPSRSDTADSRSLATLNWEAWSQHVVQMLEMQSRDLPRYALPRALRRLPARLTWEAGTLSRKGTPLRECIERLLQQNSGTADCN